MYYMSLEPEETKGSSYSDLSYYASDVNLREKKSIKRERYVHKI